jgi:tetratricopeptide (TPR) repeat protein
MCLTFSRVAALLTSLFISIAFLAATATAAQTPEGTSLLGKPLVSVPPAGEQKARLEADLARAQADYDRDPSSADAAIWLGRRLAYLGRFRAAIDVYSKGIQRHPNEPRFYRHRGHRYITIRMLDLAIDDLRKASQLIAGKPDEIEPDGAPNPDGKPRSTLQFNIWYHLALSHYLQGNYARAHDAWVECMKVSNNDDSIVATSDWMWMTLMRLNRKAEAAKVLERITPKMDILENQAYHRRLLMYKGVEKPEALLDTTSPDPTQIATQGYGVANYYLVTGDRAKARQVFEKIVSGAGWNAFGFIAAEADLQRLK